jgi:hypothetical protein
LHESAGGEQASLAGVRRTRVGWRNPGRTHGLRPYGAAVTATLQD